MSNLILKLILIPRFYKSLIIGFNDTILVISALFISYYLRLGFFYWPETNLLINIWISPIIALPIFYSFGLYRSVVRYIGLKSLFSIVQAVTLYAVIWGLIDYMVVQVDGTPRSVILINWMICLITIGGSRIAARSLFSSLNISTGKNSNVIIYGAGSAGRELSSSLNLTDDFSHVCYIDDDLSVNGTYIDNIPVFTPNKLPILVDKYNIDIIFIALPSISRKHRNQIFDELSRYSLKVINLPRVSDISKGKIIINDLLQINIRDVLGRDPVAPNESLLKIRITDKVVLVTGAGGSIGSELARQIALLKPNKLIIFDHSESLLYKIDQELKDSKYSGVQIFPILGSVISKERLFNIFQHFNVDTVYHAAAYKHVPLVEFNQSEGILNNVIGTMVASKAAISANVKTFVLISTDKAVRPTNTMGAAKRCSELVLQALAKESHKTCFTMVRFGNVLDSSGSVIPLFKKQIKRGGPITVTDINIVRYFMTISEAVELVIQSGAMGKGGDVFVLDMGEPVRIYDLAKKMVQLSGLKVIDDKNPNGDIEIQFTGLRPGEKLYEELLVDGDVEKTKNKLIMRAEESMIDWLELKPILSELEAACLNSDQEKIRQLLIKLVPEFKPQSKIVDFLY